MTDEKKEERTVVRVKYDFTLDAPKRFGSLLVQNPLAIVEAGVVALLRKKTKETAEVTNAKISLTYPRPKKARKK